MKKKTTPPQETRFNLPKDPGATLDAWRVFRIMAEFVDGFEGMTSLGPAVAIFGSSMDKPIEPAYYDLAEEIAKKIVHKGFGVITGGGPGIMERANLGARLAKGRSCGLCIKLPTEPKPNPYIDPQHEFNFHYFFTRKVMFVRYAQGFVVLPGGYGTLNEFFEALTLIQTEKIKPFPIYLAGKKYWKGMLDWLKNTVLAQGNILRKDLDLIRISDDPEEIAAGIAKHYQESTKLENF